MLRYIILVAFSILVTGMVWSAQDSTQESLEQAERLMQDIMDTTVNIPESNTKEALQQVEQVVSGSPLEDDKIDDLSIKQSDEVSEKINTASSMSNNGDVAEKIDINKLLKEVDTRYPNATHGSSKDFIESITDPDYKKKMARQLSGESDRVTPVLVFASFSMPESTLKSLFDQTNDIDATLVFRGFVNGDDVMATFQKIYDIVGGEAEGNERISAVVDPTLYERFNINKVPTFVWSHTPPKNCSETECETPEHDKVSGGMTIRYALDLFSNIDDERKARIKLLMESDNE